MTIKILVSLLTAVLLASVCLAADKPVSDGVIYDQVMIKLTSDPTVKGGAIKVDVKAGDYRATIDNNHVTLLNGKKVVAESDGRWETRDNKSPYTGIVADSNGRVLELRFEGKAEVFILSN